MEPIPPFDAAVQKLSDFLSSRNHPSQLSWAFRQDLYSPGLSDHFVCWPLPEDNAEYARRLYEKGRERGLVELTAVFTAGNRSIATVFAPMKDDIQGWDQGLKISIRDPYVAAHPVKRFAWLFHRCKFAYRRYQRYEAFIPERKGN